jgi:4-diphosphocytidyl-2-C-methyl-D-erythritol kinase
VTGAERASTTDTASMTDACVDDADTWAVPRRALEVQRTVRVVSAIPAPDAVRVRAPAKVNLHLSVGDVRPDGYHELSTVFHAVDLVDEVVARPGDGISLTISGEGAAGLPVNDANLAWRAAALLAVTAGVAPDVRLELHKTIPVAGGMAGGSADAAATLLACARLWGVRASTEELAALAARLGSDTVFPLAGGNALATGRGELLTPLATGPRLHWVFALADIGISAGHAYRTLDELRAAGRAPVAPGRPDALLAALTAADARAVSAALHNDLQQAALELAPSLADTLAAGREHGAMAGIVSGSGPTCAFLCRDAPAATILAAELEAAGACRTARTATGPAPGAQVA